jgi:meso-butanediol dehydrogenase/(S,S)-butanediol dehydrogenase/diacetyl reductase
MTTSDYRAKCVFVVDGVTGLGRKVAERFCSAGASVAIHGSKASDVSRVIKDIGGKRLVAAPADVTDVEQISSTVRKAIEAMSGLDILVCSTARADVRPVEDIVPEYWERMLAQNLKAPFFFAQACVPALKARRGCIINVASIIGLVAGPKGSVAYGTAKGAMIQMSRMMALELASDGVRVSTFCPAWTDPAETTSARDSDSNADIQAYFAERSPLRCTPTLDECADAIIELSRPPTSCATGSVSILDGGITSGHYLQ